MKKFLFICHSTSDAVWQKFVHETMLGLKSKPKNWPRIENPLPEGEWLLEYAGQNDPHIKRLGVTAPSPEQLPAILAVSEGGEIQSIHNVTDDTAFQFINDMI